MFDLAELATTFEWPCTIRNPQNGKWTDLKFTARFNLLEKDRVDAILAQARGVAQGEAADAAEVPELVEEVFEGWVPEQLKLNGAPLEETPENRERLLKNPLFRNAIVSGYFEAVGGRKVKRGN